MEDITFGTRGVSLTNGGRSLIYDVAVRKKMCGRSPIHDVAVR